MKRILSNTENSYNNNQENLIEYMISNVFPKTRNSAGDSFLTVLKERKWSDFVCKDLETSKVKVYIDGDEENINDIQEKLEVKFTDLFKSDQNDYIQIGSLLLSIYKEIKQLYNSNNLCSKLKEEQYENKLLVMDGDSTYDCDAQISSHILKFMEWLPMLPQDMDNHKLLESVDNIIDLVRDQVIAFEAAEKANAIKEKKAPRFSLSNSKMSLFCLENNQELRKLLISAMYNEHGIRTQFYQYYNFAILKEVDY